ncbi:hypothetical protein [Paraburkholderia sp. SIMBA_027]|uniref:hypothetical protein n=1 Tax=Paraburkholderia sp. SIMBA_027 TaxID=3085770 RepID=UPI00397BE68C
MIADAALSCANVQQVIRCEPVSSERWQTAGQYTGNITGQITGQITDRTKLTERPLNRSTPARWHPKLSSAHSLHTAFLLAFLHLICAFILFI